MKGTLSKFLQSKLIFDKVFKKKNIKKINDIRFGGVKKF